MTTVEKYSQKIKSAIAYGIRAANTLKVKCPCDPRKSSGGVVLPKDYDSTVSYHGLAAMLNQFVHREWTGEGDGLQSIEWAIDRLLYLRFIDYVPKLLSIYDKLVERNILSKSAVTWNDVDSKTFYIPTLEKGPLGKKELKIFVSTTQNIDYLFIIDVGQFGTDIHVRRFWDKSKKSTMTNDWYDQHRTLKWFESHHWRLKYEDARDDGYILTHKPNFGLGAHFPRSSSYMDNDHFCKIDAGHHYWTRISSCMLEIDFMYTQFVTSPDSD